MKPLVILLFVLPFFISCEENAGDSNSTEYSKDYKSIAIIFKNIDMLNIEDINHITYPEKFSEAANLQIDSVSLISKVDTLFFNPIQYHTINEVKGVYFWIDKVTGNLSFKINMRDSYYQGTSHYTFKSEMNFDISGTGLTPVSGKRGEYVINTPKLLNSLNYFFEYSDNSNYFNLTEPLLSSSSSITFKFSK